MRQFLSDVRLFVLCIAVGVLIKLSYLYPVRKK